MAHKEGSTLRNLRRLAAVVLASLAWLPTGAMPASAVSAQVITGSGIIGPGLPGPTGGTVSNSVHFGGPADGVFTVSSADFGACWFDFNGSTIDSLAVGQGGGIAVCSGTGVLGGTIYLYCELSLTRVGLTLVFTGSCNTGLRPAVLVCEWIPTNVNPFTAYDIVCPAVQV
jgi:hypothetical protein